MIPLPPTSAGHSPAEWVHLPRRVVRLASPSAVLDLLAKAVVTARGDPESISLAGGVLAVPSRRLPGPAAMASRISPGPS